MIVIPTLCDGLGLLGWPDLDLLSNSTCHMVRINMCKKRKNTTDRLGKGNVSLSGTHSCNMTENNKSQNGSTWSKSPTTLWAPYCFVWICARFLFHKMRFIQTSIFKIYAVHIRQLITTYFTFLECLPSQSILLYYKGSI